MLNEIKTATYFLPQAPVVGSAFLAADKVGNSSSLFTSGAALLFNLEPVTKYRVEI